MRWRSPPAPTLVDMEFVQFFPIGHLAPRLVGMDPIMWDPFRYKLGGRLLDGDGREFLADYGSDESARLHDAARHRRPMRSRRRWRPAAARRMAASTCRSRMCRGQRSKRPSGRSSSGWRRTASISAQMPVEVAPIAHYHMGGIAVDERMASPGAGPLRGRRSGRRRQRRQPALRQRHPRSAGVRRSGRDGSPPLLPRPKRPMSDLPSAAAPAVERIRDLADGRQRRYRGARRCSTTCARSCGAMSVRSAAPPGSRARSRGSPRCARRCRNCHSRRAALQPDAGGLVRIARQPDRRDPRWPVPRCRAHREPRRASARRFSRQRSGMGAPQRITMTAEGRIDARVRRNDKTHGALAHTPRHRRRAAAALSGICAAVRTRRDCPRRADRHTQDSRTRRSQSATAASTRMSARNA